MTDWASISDTEISPIPEKFDPSWPYNLKWGFNAQTGQAHVWRVKGGTDGRPVHRAELTQLWGRAPYVAGGDVLGLASYIPAEMKLDGTVVAPPTILVQAYYGSEVPDSIFDWFHTNFPNATVRKARLASIVTGDMDWSAPKQEASTNIKWIWNVRDGLLLWEAGQTSHNEKAMTEWGRITNETDNLGYATPQDDKIMISSFRGAAPRAIAAVKDQLKKMFPDTEIATTGHDTHDENQFHGDPAKLGRRMSAARWAQATLEVTSYDPLEGSVSDAEATVQKPDASRWLSRFLTKKKVADADMDGAMVGLFLSEEDGKKLQMKGGEPLENLHITLCFFSDKAADRDDWDEVTDIITQIAAQCPPLKGKISGYGVFTNDVDVLWASPSLQGLAELRHKIFQACEDAGFHVDTKHDWAPHITLKYDHKGKLPKLDDEITLEFKELAFARGNNQETAKFTGHFEKETAWGAQDWDGWQGPYRWATDGKEVLTEPVTDYESKAFRQVADQFRQLHPDTEKLSTGVAVPTADDMGYGVLHNGGDVPLHELVAVLDKHLEKPTHFVDGWHDIADKARYRHELPV